MKYSIEPSSFRSNNTLCDGEFVIPQGVENPPVVVMAHGFCAEKSFGLMEFAKVFAERGLAVYVFDYRGFGKSKGKIRNYVSPARHLEDWKAAIAHVRKSGLVNPHKVALWGTSFSGGHVIKTAAADASIRAIVSQVPFVDGFASAELAGPKFLRATLKPIARDLWNMVRFKEALYVPAVGEPGTFAVLNQPGCMEGFKALCPEDSDWQNMTPARAMLSTLFYRPGFDAGKLTCPAFFVIAEEDNLIPASAIKRFAKSALYGQILSLPMGHFDMYQGDLFDKASAAEADFLEEALA